MTTKTEQQEFNPSDYGFSDKYCKRSSGATNRTENQEIWVYAKRSNSKDGNTLCLKIPPSIGERIKQLFGERVNFCPNQRGQILVWNGNSRKISNNHKNNGKWVISMDMAYDEYVSYMGYFTRLYMDVEFFDNRVLFTPNGKRRP